MSSNLSSEHMCSIHFKVRLSSLSFCAIEMSIPSKVSFTRVAASTTVGTPMAITGTPSVSLFSGERLLPMPAPGFIPVSESCIVEFMRLMLLAARASMATTASGFTFSTIPFIISAVSMPVIPSTPGDTAATLPTESFISSGIESSICLVTSILLTTFGPRASGVTFQLPSPTISTFLCFSGSTSSFIFSESAIVIFFCASISFSLKDCDSIVIYFPCGLPKASLPFSLTIST